MKKYYIFLSLLFLTSYLAFSQQVLLDEDFNSSNNLPTGWSTGVPTGYQSVWEVGDNLSSQNFIIPANDGNYAVSNDDACNCDIPGDTLYSPIIDFTGLDNITLSFSSYLPSPYAALSFPDSKGYIYIFNTVDNTFTLVQEVTINASWTNVSISLDNFVSGQHRIAFVHSDDNSPNSLSGWAIDDVLVTVPFANDLSVENILSPVSSCSQANADVQVELKNNGSTTITDFTISYQVGSDAPITMPVSGVSIPFNGTYVYTFANQVSLSAGSTHEITASIDYTNDMDLTNNSLTEFIMVSETIVINEIEDFNNNLSYTWSLNSESKANSSFDNGQVLMQGTGASGWVTSGGVTSSSNAWNDNLDYQSSLILTCNNNQVPAVNSGLELSFDLRQEGFNVSTNSWFAVFVNGSQVADVEGNLSFNPASTTSDAFATKTYNLSAYKNTAFTVELYASTYRSGDKVFIDNLVIRNRNERDAGIISIVSPTSDCGLANIGDLAVVIKNYGLESISNVPVYFTINGGSPVLAGTYGPSIPAGGQTGTVTFSNQSFSGFENQGVYELYVYTELEGDILFTGNDGATVSIVSQPLITVFPYEEDFEGDIIWASEGVNSSWEVGVPAGNTIQPTQANSKALITNASGNYNNNEYSFGVSPCFDFSLLVDPFVEFSIWYETDPGMDGAMLQYTLDNGTTWLPLGIIPDPSTGNPDNWYPLEVAQFSNLGGWTEASGAWLTARHDLSALAGESSVKFRFVFASDADNTVGVTEVDYEGVAIDNLFIGEAQADIDLKLNGFVTPVSDVNLTATELVSVEVQNMGILEVNQFSLSYSINGGAAVTEIFTQTILPGETVVINFTQTADVSAIGSYTLSASVAAANDGNPTNNTIETTLLNILVVTNYPYIESFEGVNHFWMSGGMNSSWQLTVPNGTAITGDPLTNPATDNVWVTNLNGGGYFNSEDSYVQSPEFDFSSLIQPAVKLRISYKTETDVDGAGLYASTDGGNNFSMVGTIGTPPNILNWYDNTVIAANNQFGWTGQKSWVQAIQDLSNLSGESSVIFRVVFNSDVVTNDEGFAFDDFEVFENAPRDLELLSWDSQMDNCGLGNAEEVIVSIKNNGLFTETDFTVSYTIDLNGVVQTATEQVSGVSVAPGSTFVYTFTTTADLSLPGNYVVSASVVIDNATDVNTVNNSWNGQFIGYDLIDTFPYTAGFETGSEGWLSGGVNNTFEVGTPDAGNTYINTAATGQNAWVTNLDGDHAVSEESYVESQCFDLSGILVPAISFDYFVHTEVNSASYAWDGARLEYTLDGGGTWSPIGAYTADASWYTYPQVQRLGNNPGWAGLSNSWTSVSYQLTDLQGETSVRFRFVFKADQGNTTGYEGFAFDNVRIFNDVPYDFGVSAIGTTSACAESLDNEVVVTITNYSQDYTHPVGATIDLAYEFNGGAAVQEQLVLVADLLPGGTVQYTFTTTFDAPVAGTYSMVAYTNVSGDGDAANDGTTEDIEIFALPALTPDISNVICNGENNGSISFNTTADYSFVWDNASTGMTLGDLVAGDYFVSITDNVTGCVYTSDAITVTEPAVLDVAASVVNPDCSDLNSGSITLTVSGGIAPYTYTWSNLETTSDLTGIATGNYAVTVVDVNLCEAEASVFVNGPFELPYSQDFEGLDLPLAWSLQQAANSIGWEFGTDINSTLFPFFIIPSHSGYAASNDDKNDDFSGTLNDASEDLLLTPVFNLEGYTSVSLQFDAYFNGFMDEASVILYHGVNQTVIHTMTASSQWQDGIIVNLDAYAGMCGVQIGFLYNDGGEWATGFAIDNFQISGVEQYDYDLAIGSILSPITESCGFSVNEDMTVEVVNVGLLEATGASISYSINGGSVVTENLPSILAGETLSFTFAQTADLSVTGTYTIDFTINYAADLNLANNQSDIVINSLQAIESIPYEQDFTALVPEFIGEAGSEASLVISSGELVFAGGNPLSGWTGGSNATALNAFNDNVSHISSFSTVCSINANAAATLELLFDLKQVATSSANDSWFRVLVNGTVVAGPFNASQTNGAYASQVVDLDAYAGSSFSLSFEASNRSVNDQVLLDNLILREKTANIALTAVNLSQPTCTYSDNETIEVVYTNTGSLTINEFELSLYVNNVLFGTQTISSSLAAGVTASFDFVGVDLSVPGNYAISAIATLANESDLSNNSLEVTAQSVPVYDVYPFAETAGNFADFWSSYGDNSSWVYSGNWQTGLVEYNNEENSYLQSPCFDFSSLDNPIVILNLNYLTENNVDYISVEYSVDGINWTTLGAQGQGNNWYNSANGWTGSSNGAIDASIVTNLGGLSSVKFRFHLASDFSGSFTGVSLNSFEVIDSQDFGVVSIAPVEICSNSDFQIEANLINAGSSLIPAGTNVELTYQFGSSSVTESFLLSTDLASGASIDYMFATVENIEVVSNYPFELVVSSPNDLNLVNNTYQGTLNIIPGPVIGTTTNIAICEGGSVTLTATGGTTEWSGGVFNNVPFFPVTTSDYTVTVTAANGCQATSTTTVVVNPLPEANAGEDQFVCEGELTTLTAAGGTTYQWIGLGNTASIEVIVDETETYTVLVTDANGCSDFATVTVNSLDLPIGSVTADLTICNDQSATLTAIGGDTYSWSTGATDSSIEVSPLATQNYDVTITNLDGCSVVEEVEVTVNNRPVVTNAIVTPNYCFEGSAGSIELTVDGMAPIQYEWSNSLGTANSVDNLPAGTYSVTIQDALGSLCPSVYEYTITEPAGPMVATIVDVANHVGYSISCNGANDGSLLAVVTAGNSPFVYNWSNGVTTSANQNLAPGVYTLTVTDVNSCVATAEYTVTEPAVLSVIETISDVTCNGANDGEIELSVTGGTQPYNFNWTTLSMNSSNPVLDQIGGGTYELVLTDANGCSITQSYSVAEPDPLTVTNVVLSDYNGYQVSCPLATDGSINLTAQGGNGSYVYNWSNGATTSSIDGLGAGTYTLTLSDAVGCEFVQSFTLAQPFPISTSISSTNVSCFGGDNGAINLNVSFGGVPPFTFEWSNGATTEDISGLTAGVYTVTISDQNNCGIEVSRTVNQPAELIATAFVSSDYNGSDVTCPGATDGSVSVSVVGGVQPYTYNWDVEVGSTNQTLNDLAAGTYDLTVTDANGCTSESSVTIVDPEQLSASVTVLSNYGLTNTNVTCFGGNDGSAEVITSGGSGTLVYNWSNSASGTSLVNDLTAGVQTIIVTDGNGCSVEVEFELTQPEQLVLSAGVEQEVSCTNADDGAVGVIANGGVGSYVYSWSTGATTASIANLSAGTYEVTVQDGNGCIAIESVVLNNPIPVSVNLVATSNYNGFNVSCNGGADGTANAIAAGGTGVYTYAWSVPSLEGATVGNLSAIAYSVTATDENGCSANDFIVLTQPAALEATSTLSDFNGFNIDCNGNATGSISVAITGGYGAYTYSWSDGSTNTLVENLSAGSYELTVTDENGCELVLPYTLTEPGVLALSFTTSDYNGYDVSCNGGSDGEISVEVTEGVLPYIYSWSNGATDASLSSLEAGSYEVTVTDANGCELVSAIVLEAAPALAIDAIVINSDYNGFDVSCNEASDGSATVSMSVGIEPYTYMWSSGETSATATLLTGGMNYVTVTDANDCSIVGEIELTAPSVFLVDVAVISDYNGNDVTCTGNMDAIVKATPVTGFGPYTYAWSTGATTDAVGGLGAGVYTVTVTDANGCVYESSVEVMDAEPISYTYDMTQVSCNGFNNGSIDVTVSGGTGTYMYFWNHAENTEDVDNLMPGVYYFLAIDENWCHVVSELFYIEEPAELTVSAEVTSDYSGFGVSCFNTTDGAISSMTTGGTEPYAYMWSNGESTADLTNVGGGTYTLTVTDANNCVVTTEVVVSSPAEFAANITLSDFNGFGVSCNGSTDGSISIIPVDGVAPVSFTWSDGSTSDNLTGLTAGVYYVTLTDFNGCAINYELEITEPTNLEASFSVTSDYNGYDVSCFNTADGNVTAILNGGVTPYTYLWANGETTASIMNGVAGDNMLTVTDANGCTLETVVNLDSPSEIVLAITEGSSITCNGAANGQLVADVTGGMGNYVYLWSNGEVTPSISNLAEGTYSLTVTDGTGCMVVSEYDFVAPELLTVTVDVQNPACNGQTDGFATAIVSGGVEPYSYYWSNGATTASITDLGPGIYYLFVLDANNCASTFVPFEIINPAAFDVNLVVTQANVCGDESNGAIELNLIGLNGTHSTLWSNGETTDNISGLGNGSYTVTVSNATGCEIVQTATINSDSHLELDYVVSDNLCAGSTNGSIGLMVTGGSGNLSYAWSNGATSDYVDMLASGNYSVTVTDALSCTIVEEILVEEPAAIVVSSTVSMVSCNGLADGSVMVSLSGGIAPYNYTWSNGATSLDNTGLLAGNYEFSYTDANGCEGVESFVVAEPAVLALDLAGIDEGCADGALGSVTAMISGGTEPYTYTWSNGGTDSFITELTAGTYTLTVVDASNCSVEASTTLSTVTPLAVSALVNPVSCNGLSDGMVDVTVTGGNGTYYYNWEGNNLGGSSVFNWDYSITDNNHTVVIPANAAISVNGVSIANGDYIGAFYDNNGVLECAGYTEWAGAVTSVAVWGDDGVTTTVKDGFESGETMQWFIWQAATGQTFAAEAEYGTLNVTHAGNWAAFGTSSILGLNALVAADLVDVVAGEYFLTVTDENGCYTSTTVQVSEPDALMLESTLVDATCEGNMDASIAIQVSGGTAPYVYSWNNGSTDMNQTGLAAGLYDVVVTDANGCELAQSFELTYNILTLTADMVEPSAFGEDDGSISVVADGGVAPYSYSWSNGATNAMIEGLVAGNYEVTVVDANLCQVIALYELGQPAPPLVVDYVITQPTACLTDGMIDLTVSGGTGVYSYAWSNGDLTEDLLNVGSGLYTVTVSDANGYEFILSELELMGITMDVEFIVSNNVCFGGSEASVTVLVNNQLPASFEWAHGPASDYISNLEAGNYTVTITDTYGCTVVESVSVVDPDPMVVEIIHTSIGLQANVVSGATGMLSYSWSNGKPYQSIKNLVVGQEYCVTVTDANGCQGVACATWNGGVSASVAMSKEDIILSLDESDIKLFPNPTRDGMVTIELPAIDMDRVQIDILDNQGRVVYQEAVYQNAGNMVRANLGNLRSGIYFARINLDDIKLVTKRIVVTR